MPKARYTPEERRRIKAETLRKNIEKGKLRGYSQKNPDREKALKEGRKFYISGTPCKKCGCVVKYVSTYGCHYCVKREGLKKLADKELMSPYRTKEKKREGLRRWRENNYDKWQQQWLRAPKEKVNARAANRRAKVRNQTPDLTEAEKDAILELYAEAKRLTEETGIAYEVDHIVPICKGGLHHPDNLRVITQKENRKKGGR